MIRHIEYPVSIEFEHNTFDQQESARKQLDSAIEEGFTIISSLFCSVNHIHQGTTTMSKGKIIYTLHRIE